MIQSIDGFDNFSNLTGKSDGGFKYSLAPVLGQSPFAFKQAIFDLENSQDASGEVSSSRQIELMKQYGFVSDLLPASFEGNILAIYNSNGSLHKTISVSSDDFDPFSGELGRLNDNDMYGMGGDYIFDMYDDINLSHEEAFKGTWQNESNMYGTTTNGTFYYYKSLLDMNSNGIIDRLELAGSNTDPAGGGNTLSYPVNLSAASIAAAQSSFETYQPTEIKGNVIIERMPMIGYNTGNISITDYSRAALLFVSSNDAVMIDELEMNDGMYYVGETQYSTFSYNYENGNEYYGNADGNSGYVSFTFNDNHSGVALFSDAQFPER